MIKTIINILKDPSSRATALVFLALAAVLGAWFTRLPEIKQNLDLSEAELGTSLFFIPLGAASLLPFYSKIISSLGDRITIKLAILFFVFVIILPGEVMYKWQFMATLYFVGLGVGLTDVAMNAEAATIEKDKKLVIMSACHGFFSLGGMIGALLGSFLISLSVSITLQMSILAVLFTVILIPNFKHLINAQTAESVGGLTLPAKELIVFAVIGFCIMLSEGGISEWSTIFLKDNLEMKAEYAGFGFAGFSLLMAIGRFKGDQLITKFGGKPLIIVGAIVSIAGLVLVQTQLAIMAITGFSLAGLGYSVIVPILFSSAAKVKGVSAAKGVASVASAGYIGMLSGPVIIGFVADSFGLSNGFLFLLLLTLLGMLISIFAIKK